MFKLYLPRKNKNKNKTKNLRIQWENVNRVLFPVKCELLTSITVMPICKKWNFQKTKEVFLIEYYYKWLLLCLQRLEKIFKFRKISIEKTGCLDFFISISMKLAKKIDRILIILVA